MDPEDTSEEDIETVQASSWRKLLGCAPLAEELAGTAALDSEDKEETEDFIKRRLRDAPVAEELVGTATLDSEDKEQTEDFIKRH